MRSVQRSFRYAYYGLKYCFSTQRNMTIHTVIGLVVVVAATILRVTTNEMLLLFTAIALVLVAETFNTALERAIDLFTIDRNRLAHVAKDVAAGAVLIASFYALAVGLVILGPPLWNIFWGVF
ncbi:MAG TPA: diacylglycerol kinase family protein [Candidatus Limnocylindrales bacterium]|nr:diacylglycerol kinase family protein [Candidatus Limnocylindrales bacterium]